MWDLGQEGEGGRVVRSRDENQRAGLRGGSDGARQARAIVAIRCPESERQVRRGLPWQRPQHLVLAETQGEGEIMQAEVGGDGLDSPLGRRGPRHLGALALEHGLEQVEQRRFVLTGPRRDGAALMGAEARGDRFVSRRIAGGRAERRPDR